MIGGWGCGNETTRNIGRVAANRYLPNALRERTLQPDHPERRIHPENLAPHRATLARTYGLITQIDDAVGAIVESLDLSEALLYFTSDHGDYGHRGLLRKIPWIPFDDLARVPCFATGGLVAEGRRELSPMQSFDVAVTSLALAAIDMDLDPFDGIDSARCCPIRRNLGAGPAGVQCDQHGPPDGASRKPQVHP